MPIVWDIEPEADDESAYRCWSCGQLLIDFGCTDRLCRECLELEREEIREEVRGRLTDTLADIAATAGGAL